MGKTVIRKFKTNAGGLDAITGFDENCNSVVLTVHGMMEYKERYRDFWDCLLKNGYGYAAFDLPAHGASVPEGKDTGEWPENGFRTSLDAIREITGFLKEEHNKDVYIFGHSLGSFITLGAISEFGNEYAGCALSGSGDKQPAALLGSGKALAWIIGALKGRDHKSELLHNLTFGSYNKRIKDKGTEFDWLSSDSENVDEYIRDPLCGFLCSAGFYKDFTDMLSTLYEERKLKNIPRNLPIILLSGKEDPVGLYGEGIKNLSQRIARYSGSKPEIRIYEGSRHEILNDHDKETVMEDIVDFFNMAESRRQGVGKCS